MRMILLGSQQVLRDRQRADRVVGNDPARVADHVGLPLGQPEDPVGVEAGVHAGEHGDALAGAGGRGRSPVSKPSA